MLTTKKYKLSYTRRKWNKRDCRELLQSCTNLHDICRLRDKLIFDKLRIGDDFLNRKISYSQFNKRTNKVDFMLSNLGSNLISFFIEQAIEELAVKGLDKRSYRYKARFLITPKNISSVIGYELLQELGYYNRSTNPEGVVRDHRFSIYDGQSLGIDPIKLGNIHNCEFLTHKDNLYKGRKSSISLNEFNNLPVSG